MKMNKIFAVKKGDLGPDLDLDQIRNQVGFKILVAISIRLAVMAEDADNELGINPLNFYQTKEVEPNNLIAKKKEAAENFVREKSSLEKTK